MHRSVDGVLERAGVAPCEFIRLGVGRPPDRRTEVRAPAEFRELHPRLDLLGRRIVRQLGQGGPHQGREFGVAAQAVEGEVGYLPVVFGAGERGEPVYEVRLVPRDRAQDGPAYAQGPDPGVQGVGVRGHDLRQGRLPVQHLADGRQVESELAQGAGQIEAGERVGAVEPVARRALVGEPDCLHR
ncbi:hypothetical protein ACFYP6_13065 [Streptomyces goshikiensis]|uniref:hypothetical protein n=1 Tax=Streptomyces goshikiensis TaxID=1942 RepID=UPI0036A33568